MKELLDYDPNSGLKTWFVADASDTTFHIHYEQDTAPSIEYAKALYNDADYKSTGIKNGMQHYAHVTDIVILEWRSKYGVDIFNPNHAQAVKRLLRDPAYRSCRVAAGNI